MKEDLPQITTSTYASNTTNPLCFDQSYQTMAAAEELTKSLLNRHWISPMPLPQATETIIMPKDSTTRRIVQVFIADPNENVPLEKSVLYTGEQKLTDLNDTELFFEVPIKELLEKHNAFRVTVTDKEASKRAGKDILLDPVKIRDLKMVVVTVAQF